MTSMVHVRGLSIVRRSPRAERIVLHDVDLDIAAGESHGLVGESGAGKSTLALALARFLPRGTRAHAQRLVVAGQDVLALRGSNLHEFRRGSVGFVFQDANRAFNPTATVGAQISESHRLRGTGRRESRRAASAALDLVGFPLPEVIAQRYPHELSGGQQQRALIAMALASRPRLLILDEPTSGLDRRAAHSMLELIARLQAQEGFASLLISHDDGLIAGYCRRVSVLRGGRLTALPSPGKTASRPEVADFPANGTLVRRPSPTNATAPAVVRGSRLGKSYASRDVLRDLSFELRRGETLAVLGESGVGKSTLARIVAGLTTHQGSLVVDAPRVPPPVQAVFQNPAASLNPRRTVEHTLSRAIKLLHGEGTPRQLVERVGVAPSMLDRLPHELSGGEIQRVAIARAFAGGSPVIVCDEPTASLDAAAQARVLDLLIELQDESGVAYLFVTHDVSVAWRIAHRALLLEGAGIAQIGPASEILPPPI